MIKNQTLADKMLSGLPSPTPESAYRRPNCRIFSLNSPEAKTLPAWTPAEPDLASMSDAPWLKTTAERSGRNRTEKERVRDSSSKSRSNRRRNCWRGGDREHDF